VDVRANDRGAATVLALALVQLLLLVAVVGAVVGTLALARARAAAVADLAAVAAAQSWGDPCADARAVADVNGMAVVSCSADGPDIVVQVATPAPDLVGRWLALMGREASDVRASARAGVP
jgi:secretion/DNA translocation related TadE-like protein